MVFYSIDYVPNRFGLRLLNIIYHHIDEWSSRHADIVWNVSVGIERGRSERCPSGRRAPHLVVPIGVTSIVGSPQTFPFPRLVFVGNVLEKQGVQHLLAALPIVAAQISRIELVVVGTGPYLASLRRLASALGVNAHVRFLGHIKSEKALDEILALGGIGAAVYDCDASSFTRYADPGKVKRYLAAGLPILITDVPDVARLLADRGAAVLVEPTADAVATATIRLLRDPDAFQAASRAALQSAAGLTWNEIFDWALMESGIL
ncbi:MAG TPA: glycosyltransferase [Acidimicrobiales bacterium]|nr:glycosyltransferase [Acidimicrobiales bacterium]